MKLELFINHKKRKVDYNHVDSLINMEITSLEGLLPALQDRTTLYIRYNKINLLDGLPPMLTKLNISFNKIKSLDGLPLTLIFLDISQNQITSLEGLPPSLTYLDISCNRITSLDGLPPTITTLYISHNQITSLDGLPPTLTSLIISSNKINSLEGLPPLLKFFGICGNQITSLEGLPSTLTYLAISYNQITSLEGLPPTLAELDASNNQITSLEGLPVSITKLSVINNQITTLPISLVHLRNLRCFYYSNNPIELGEIHPSVQRCLDNYFRQKTTIYDDKQNVHNVAVQNSIRESLNKLTNYPQKVLVSKLVKEEYEFLNSTEVHSFFHFTQTEVLMFVENAISLCPEEVKEQLYSLLKEALREGRSVCATGRIGRLVNVLSGFDPNVEIKISNNSQIGAIVSSFRERGEPRETLENELLSRGIEKDEIDEWLEHY